MVTLQELKISFSISKQCVLTYGLRFHGHRDVLKGLPPVVDFGSVVYHNRAGYE